MSHNLIVGTLKILLRVVLIRPIPPNRHDLLLTDDLKLSSVQWTSMIIWRHLVLCPLIPTVRLRVNIENPIDLYPYN